MENKNQNKSHKLKVISVKGAKLHNLKNISVDIPHNKLTVISGVSGSGKSTLAFDTIYAEGQRRFVESLSAYARQFLERMGKPDVDSISGLPPAIAIEQRPAAKNPRSTVGTATEIYDYLRLLFGRIGETICRKCGKTVKKDNPSSVIKNLLNWNEDDKLYILFPISPQVRNIDDELKKFRTLGFFRLLLKDNNEVIDYESGSLPEGTPVEDIFILADRLVIRKDSDSITRLSDSVETAFDAGGGRIVIRNISNGEELRFSSKYECTDCEILYEEPEPRLFSFNNPYGACPSCQGFGRTIDIDEDLIIPDKSKSLRMGAIHPFRTAGFSKYQRDLVRVAAKHDIPLDAPVQSLTDEQNSLVWEGVDDYIGINGFFTQLEENSYKLHYRVLISRYRGYTRCKACGGSRLRTSARQVFVGGKSIPDLIKMPLDSLFEFFSNLQLNEYQLHVVSQVIRELKWRLQLLVDIGLEYLTLDRLSHSLSGGEAQRINLSTALGSSLVGTLYVLDEPSIGMHPRDTGRLLKILNKLRDLGNTIIVVEHDPDIINNADFLVDIGPNAGEHGGEIVFAGRLDEIQASTKSLTAMYLTGKKKINITRKRNKVNKKVLTLFRPRLNNLKIDKVEFPMSCMTVVTGVSGSGKSTLVHDVLYAGLKRELGGIEPLAGSYDKIDGYYNLEQIEMVDQSPIGRSSRSTPITYTKVFDTIRDVFASTQAAKQMGWKPGHFSFNVPGGRCEVCEGEGSVTVEMQFLPDVHLECEACKGTRYKKEARSILFKEKSIVDVLNMTVDEAAAFFQEIPRITKKLNILRDVGLGYLRLGQPSNMLSGGESQRIKLASHLETSDTTEKMFIFDEPTTGLHLDDISKLLECFRRLVDAGHSVIIIEHNIHIIASADWIIDLGPEAGEKGGNIVACGTPEHISRVPESYTGKALKEFYQSQVR